MGIVAKLIAWVLPARPKKLAAVYVKLAAQMFAEKALAAPPYTPLCQDPRCEKCVRARMIAALYLAHPN